MNTLGLLALLFGPWFLAAVITDIAMDYTGARKANAIGFLSLIVMFGVAAVIAWWMGV